MDRSDFNKWLAFHRKLFPQVDSFLRSDRVEADRWFTTLRRFKFSADLLTKATNHINQNEPDCYPTHHLNRIINFCSADCPPEPKQLNAIKAHEHNWENGGRDLMLAAASDPRVDELSQTEIEALIGTAMAKRFLNGGRQSPVIRSVISEMLEETK